MAAQFIVVPCAFANKGGGGTSALSAASKWEVRIVAFA